MNIVIGICSISLAIVSFSQTPPPQEEGTRAIWDAEFRRQRPTSKAPTKPTVVPRKPSEAPATSLLGLTVWRFRPSVPSDPPGARVLVHGQGTGGQVLARTQFTPIRLASSKPLQDGDRVIVSLEASRSGYLYVINQELLAGGAFGDPILLFPSSRIRNGDNRVAPGRVVRIPDQFDDPAYLTVSRTRPDAAGETLIALLSPDPIPELAGVSGPQLLDRDEVAEWEKKWGSRISVQTSAKGDGQLPSSNEVNAAKGHDHLTSDDPTPEFLYRSDDEPTAPMLVRVQLKLASRH